MIRRLLSLDDEAARDSHQVGSKGAALSRARALAMPVLPGWVVPVGEAAVSVAIGAELIRRGSSEACAAMSTLVLDRGLVGELERVAAGRGGTWIVRSSSVRDGDRRWAGGFSTYHDIPAGGVPNAVRACWASAFTRQAVRRRQELGEPSHDVKIAVLIQPWLAFDFGGVATRVEDANVTVSWVRGGPAGLMGGSRGGTIIQVDGDGRPTTEAPGHMRSLFEKVANLVREVAAAGLGDWIEWGSSGGDVLLLQVDRSSRPDERRATTRRMASPAFAGSTVARRIALAASLFPAPLGEELVLPWAAAPGADLTAIPCGVTDPAGSLREAIVLGERLTFEAWGARRPQIAGEIAATFRGLLGPAPDASLDRMARLRPVDRALSHRAVSLLRAIARHLVDDGRLQGEHEIWRLSPTACAQALGGSGELLPIPLGPDRWEPFVFDVARSNGDAARGTPISAAIGAGWTYLPGPGDVECIAPRRVVVLGDPVPHAAPLLWGSAGLVTANGTVGAHLFEVARSLGVPAVAGVDLTDRSGPSVVAVDGYSGDVTVLTSAHVEHSVKEAEAI